MCFSCNADGWNAIERCKKCMREAVAPVRLNWKRDLMTSATKIIQSACVAIVQPPREIHNEIALRGNWTIDDYERANGILWLYSFGLAGNWGSRYRYLGLMAHLLTMANGPIFIFLLFSLEIPCLSFAVCVPQQSVKEKKTKNMMKLAAVQLTHSQIPHTSTERHQSGWKFVKMKIEI